MRKTVSIIITAIITCAIAVNSQHDPATALASESCSAQIATPAFVYKKHSINRIKYQSKVTCNGSFKVETILRINGTDSVVAFKKGTSRKGKVLTSNGFASAKGCYRFYTQVYIINKNNAVIYNEGSDVSEPLC